MTYTIKVALTEQSGGEYPIYIDDYDLGYLREKLDSETDGHKRLIIFSKKVWDIYGKTLDFDRSEVFVLKDGECEKNIKNYEKIIKKAIELKLSRKDYIIAIGGGVVGDMAGFAAATYMRGIGFIQVPTTLLACVDSSVGGKTAIDMPKGKNYVGAFYQPKAVYINLNFLKTLDEKQYKSGFGEVIKYGFIEKSCNAEEDYNLLKILKDNIENYSKRDNNFLKRIITICLELKASVVHQDEKEKGLRKILNLGHTFGHALEEETKYRRYTHGYAVVLGMMYIFNYGLKNGFCNREYYDDAFTLMQAYGYKTDRFLFINKKRTLKYMLTDKKSSNGVITFIIPTEKGVVTEHKTDNLSSLSFDVDYCD